VALVLPIDDIWPLLGRDVFVAPNATLIGDVELGDEASVWFGAVIRADIGPIRVGPRTNIQDLSCLHLTGEVSTTTIGADVTVGHNAILHGCSVGDGCLVGMGSIILDNAEIGAESLIAAGALVTPRTIIPPRSLVRGSPGKVVRQVTDEEVETIRAGSAHYVANARRFLALCDSERDAARGSSR
jgi:carbonic anhydrase/acetyltransferase-like protein (isoleucine patch superfamily)